ncbi:GNAT family N-acetyltransferase [Sporosarcina sp. A2]|uniref:GNAT family N-acetyltransferase n=1 Tax=Sporosarcina sp. A2 TaxID=3393449 RepID=UPI003D78EDC1
MHIRKIKERDNALMAHIIRESLESFGLNISGTAYYDPQLNELAQFYEKEEDACYWVALSERDEVVGGVGIGPYNREAGICELQKLYVAPEAQGVGMAKQLMATALEFAAQHYKHCYLETSTKLEVASRLYEKLGFTLLDKPLDGSEHGAMDAWYLKKLRE